MKTNNDMRNIHVLPTDKPSRLNLSKVRTETEIVYKLVLKTELSKCNDGLLSGPRNIYITNDEEIKEGNWVLGDYPDNPIGKVISKYGEEFTMQSLNGNKHGLAQYDSKKIILTTDQDLIKDGVQAIDDDFLEWFIKNQNCEEVEVNKVSVNCSCANQSGYRDNANVILENSTCHLRNNCKTKHSHVAQLV